MKTTIEVNGYEIVIQEADGMISVSAMKDGEMMEEFELESGAQSQGEEMEDVEDIEMGDEDEMKDFDEFGQDEEEEDDFEGQSQDEDEDEDEEEGEEEEEEDEFEEEESEGKLESFQSFLKKRKK